MRRIYLLVLVLVVSNPGVRGQELPPQGDPEWYKYNDPFGEDLDAYKHRMSLGSTLLVSGIIVLVSGLLLGTASQTFRSADLIDPYPAMILSYSAYTLAGAGAGISLTGLFVWKGNAENYYETLQLQMRYYNLITQ